MKKLLSVLLITGNWSIVTAFAAGTYYTPQSYQPANQPRVGYYTPQSYANRGYQPVGSPTTRYQQVPATGANNAAPDNATSNGLWLDANFTRAYGQWEFEMAQSGSKLHYDNLSWNIFNANAGYNFAVGNTTVGILGGISYGSQASDSTMVDDDITNGGYFTDDTGTVVGHALSIGTTGGGDMFGYHAGIELPDVFRIGNMKISPSVGWRNLEYKLTTGKNFGINIDTATDGCFDESGEWQCNPAAGDGTYYYEQPITSHSYEVEWAGPYVALGLGYDINQNNMVTGRVELGLPGYTSTGDQPYRFDWAHPKSVEDTADMGSAMHIGLAADWKTALTNSIWLTVGLTYDHYTIGGATATTYLNQGFYTDLYDEAVDVIEGTIPGDAALAANVIEHIEGIYADCPNWVCTQEDEVDSFFKSIGVRVGIAAKF